MKKVKGGKAGSLDGNTRRKDPIPKQRVKKQTFIRVFEDPNDPRVVDLKRAAELDSYYSIVNASTARVSEKLRQLELLEAEAEEKSSSGEKMGVAQIEAISSYYSNENYTHKNEIVDTLESTEDWINDIGRRDMNKFLQDAFVNDTSSTVSDMRLHSDVTDTTESGVPETEEDAGDGEDKGEEEDINDMLDDLVEDDDNLHGTKDPLDPEHVFGGYGPGGANRVKYESLLEKCDIIKNNFAHSLGTLLEKEKVKMMREIEEAEPTHRRLDGEIRNLRDKQEMVDRQLRTYDLNELKIKNMIEERLKPTMRTMQEHIDEQVDVHVEHQEELERSKKVHEHATKLHLDISISRKNLEDGREMDPFLLKRAEGHVTEFLIDIAEQEAQVEVELQSKMREGAVKLTLSRQANTETNVALKRAEEILESVLSHKREFEDDKEKSTEIYRASLYKLNAEVLLSDREASEMQTLLDELMRAKRRKEALAMKKDMLARRNARQMRKTQIYAKTTMQFGEKGTTEKVILGGRDKVKLNPAPPAAATPSTHLTLTEALEDLDMDQVDEVNDVEDEALQSNSGTVSQQDQETISNLIGSNTEDTLGLGKSLLSRQYMKEHDRKSRGSLKKDRVFTMVGTDDKGANIMVNKVHKPYRSVVAFGCYADYIKAWPSIQAKGDGGDKDREQSTDLDTMRVNDMFDREALEMNDIDRGMEALLAAMQDLKSHELADRLLIEDIAAEVQYMKRSFRVLSNQPSIDSAQLEQKLRCFSLELLESIFTVTPRLLLLKNKRYLLAVAVKGLCTVLSVYLHASRGDCSQEDFTTANSLGSADMEEVSSTLINLIVSGSDSDMPPGSKSVKSVKRRSTKRGSSKKKKNKVTEVEVLTAPQFTNAVYDAVAAIPEVGVRLQKPKSVINRILSTINRMLYSNEEGGMNPDDENTSFDLHQRNVLYGCVVYLISVCSSEDTSTENLFGLMDSIKDAGNKLGYEKNVSILPPLADLLKTVSPHIIPGILCLDLFCRFLDEELARREFIHRIARRDVGVSDLQFLNVTLPHAADAEINATAARAREEAKLSTPNRETFQAGGDLIHRLKAARQHWMTGLASYVEKQSSRIVDTVWRAKLKENDGITYDDTDMPLPSHVQASILDHIKTIRGIARRKQRLSKDVVKSLETDLRSCVSSVYKTIERLVEAYVALEGPIHRRMYWLQKQLLALEKRNLIVSAEFKQNNDKLQYEEKMIQSMKNRIASWGEKEEKGRFKGLTPDLRKYVEDPDDDGLTPILESQRNETSDLIDQLEALKEEYSKLAWRVMKLNEKGGRVTMKKSYEGMSSIVATVQNIETFAKLATRGFMGSTKKRADEKENRDTQVSMSGEGKGEGVNELPQELSLAVNEKSTMSRFLDDCLEGGEGISDTIPDDVASDLHQRWDENYGSPQTPKGFYWHNIGPPLIFVNEHFKVAVKDPQGGDGATKLVPLIRRYVLIDRRLQEHAKQWQGGDLDAEANIDPKYVLELQAGGGTSKLPYDDQRAMFQQDTDTLPPSQETVVFDEKYFASDMELRFQHEQTASLRNKDFNRDLNLLHPIIVSILERQPLDIYKPPLSEYNTAAKNKPFVEGDIDAQVPWLFDLNFALPEQPLLDVFLDEMEQEEQDSTTNEDQQQVEQPFGVEEEKEQGVVPGGVAEDQAIKTPFIEVKKHAQRDAKEIKEAKALERLFGINPSDDEDEDDDEEAGGLMAIVGKKKVKQLRPSTIAMDDLSEVSIQTGSASLESSAAAVSFSEESKGAQPMELNLGAALQRVLIKELGLDLSSRTPDTLLEYRTKKAAREKERLKGLLLDSVDAIVASGDTDGEQTQLDYEKLQKDLSHSLQAMAKTAPGAGKTPHADPTIPSAPMPSTTDSPRKKMLQQTSTR